MHGHLLRIRDHLLDRLLRVDDTVLNEKSQRRADLASESILAAPVAHQIGWAASEIERAAVANNGRQVHYQLVEECGAFQLFRDQIAPGLAQFDPLTLKSRQEQLSFWINLYNLLVIHAALVFRVQKSVTEGPAGVLRFFRRAAYRVGGQRMSLDDIEQGVLRANRGHPYLPGPQFHQDDPRRAWVLQPFDPRIHWGLNCASRSCPPLRSYRPETIDRSLDEAAHNFIRNHVQVDVSAGVVHVSAIFNWFSKDFGGKTGILSYILDCLPADGRWAWIEENRATAKIRFQPYDWRLNSVTGATGKEQ